MKIIQIRTFKYVSNVNKFLEEKGLDVINVNSVYNASIEKIEYMVIYYKDR